MVVRTSTVTGETSQLALHPVALAAFFPAWTLSEPALIPPSRSERDRGPRTRLHGRSSLCGTVRTYPSTSAGSLRTHSRCSVRESQM